jgi:inosine-uridine nucleoside N-ribohydrolase
VVNHTPACQKVFEAPWDMTITPLDTCGLVVLDGEKYQTVRQSTDPLNQALMENYRVWLRAQNNEALLDVRSSTLFDTVAVYLAFTDELTVMKTLSIRVTDDGMTVVDEKAKPMRVAVDWKDLDGFETFLVDRLTQGLFVARQN